MSRSSYAVNGIRYMYIDLTYSGLIRLSSTPHTSKRFRRLNHNLSNLSPANEVAHRICLRDVIRRKINGELGSTEVPNNQIW